jgi:hypothetical protein
VLPTDSPKIVWRLLLTASTSARTEPEKVQEILHDSRFQTTLHLYIQEDSDEAWGAQGEFPRALGMQSELMQ